jgi:hypothetical protein
MSALEFLTTDEEVALQHAALIPLAQGLDVQRLRTPTLSTPGSEDSVRTH